MCARHASTNAVEVMSRVAMADGALPLTVAFWRAVIAAVLLTVHAAVTRAEPLRRADRPAAVFLGVAGVAVLYFAYLNAIEQGGVALSSVLVYSAPIWVAIGGRIFFQERVSARATAALALTLVGVAIVALASGTGEVRWSPSAVGWGLLSGAMYALYFLVGRRLFSRNASARVMAWALGVGAVTMLPFVQFQSLSRSAWAGVATATCRVRNLTRSVKAPSANVVTYVLERPSEVTPWPWRSTAMVASRVERRES
mgnify:CR=1 FL=1